MLFQLTQTTLISMLIAGASAQGLTTQWDPISLEQACFASRLIPELYGNTADPTGNQCSSILGISMVLDLVFPGAASETSQQMCNVLGFSCDEQSFSRLRWKEISDRLESDYDGSCRSGCDPEDAPDLSGVPEDTPEDWRSLNPTLAIANSIWVDSARDLDEGYTKLVSGLVHKTDFDDASAGKTINRWIFNETKGFIDAVVEEGPILAKLIAVNTIYFNAAWDSEFRADRTSVDKFYADPERSSVAMEDAYFMHTVFEFPYSDDVLPGYQLLKLNYQFSRMSMIIALKIDNDDNAPVNPPAISVINAIPLLTIRRVALALPTFKFGAKYIANDALKESGLTLPFEDDSFCGLVADGCLYIDKLIQMTSIYVHEKGTSAAAVTVAMMFGGMPPEEQPTLFRADHPFAFYIYDSRYRIVLFEGIVGHPDQPPGAPTPTFAAKHEDPDFWTTNFWGVDVAPTVSIERSRSTPTAASIIADACPTVTPTSLENPNLVEASTCDRWAGLHIPVLLCALVSCTLLL